MKKACFLLVMLLLIFSCNNEDAVEPVDDIIFTGITERDETGAKITNDSTDWQLIENWQAKEEALFEEAFSTVCDTAGYGYSILAYPNPCQDMITLRITKPTDSRVSFRIVDKDFNVVFSRDTTDAISIFLNTGAFNLAGDTARIYYKFIKQDCELKGHGDVAINL